MQGQWATKNTTLKKGHWYIADYAAEPYEISDECLKMLKLGAIFNDYQNSAYPKKSLAKLKAAEPYGDNSDWHGSKEDASDYVSAYYVVATMANRGISSIVKKDAAGKYFFTKDEFLPPELQGEVTVSQFNRMRKQFDRVYDTNVEEDENVKNNVKNPTCLLKTFVKENSGVYNKEENRKYFLIGMSLHILSDVFDFKKMRYEAAKRVCRKALARAEKGRLPRRKYV